jgi:hypothetical protein
VLLRRLNIPPTPKYEQLYRLYLDNMKSQVGETLWQTWWAEGKKLSQEEVITLALQASAAVVSESPKLGQDAPVF